MNTHSAKLEVALVRLRHALDAKETAEDALKRVNHDVRECYSVVRDLMRAAGTENAKAPGISVFTQEVPQVVYDRDRWADVLLWAATAAPQVISRTCMGRGLLDAFGDGVELPEFVRLEFFPNLSHRRSYVDESSPQTAGTATENGK